MGGFKIAYSVDIHEKYEKFLKTAADIWADWTGANIDRTKKEDPVKYVGQFKKPPQLKVIRGRDPAKSSFSKSKEPITAIERDENPNLTQMD